MPGSTIAISYIVSNAHEAEDVIKGMRRLIEMYGFATKEDLHDLLGVETDYEDAKVGWDTMAGVHHHPNRSGEELVFPAPKKIEELQAPSQTENELMIAQLRTHLVEIQHQIKVIEQSNFLPEGRMTVWDLRNTDGTYTMVPLLVARAQTVNAIALLRVAVGR